MNSGKDAGRRRDREGALRLIEAGEFLFGRYGLDGPTMQQIRIAAGSSNKYAVQYHFGTIDGLIDALLSVRMPSVDGRQAELLAGFVAEGRGEDIRALLSAFFRPLLEQVNSQGEQNYARFMSAMLVSTEGERHFQSMLHVAPTTGEILRRLHLVLPHVPPDVLARRLRLITGMVCTSMFALSSNNACREEEAQRIQDTLSVAAAGLGAPTAQC